ncbi:MAG: hypothetical protein FWC24_01670 [Treponema sp.]|nr:hypothetical protein [Treponema sp.]
MKKYIILLLCITLFLPLYAQEADGNPGGVNDVGDEFAAMDESFNEIRNEALSQAGSIGNDQAASPQYEKIENFGDEYQFIQPEKAFTFARQRFELGFDNGGGFDNDLIGLGDFFKTEIILDLDKIKDIVGDDGFNVNAGFGGGMFINVKNISISEGKWDFGFFSGADGAVNFNIPQSLFTLVSQGNINQHVFEGMISASGGIYANAGLRASAKYGKLRVGLRPTLFAPLIFIPKSGITYSLNTEESIAFSTLGEISIYSPIMDVIDGRTFNLQYGFDLAMEGEYDLFPFLDVGGSFSRIPFSPARMESRALLTMKGLEDGFEIKGEDLLAGQDISDKLPDFDNIDFDQSFDIFPHKVFRPMRFDTYARYKPFNTNILAIVPNLGFSVDINDKQGYFNGGLTIQLNVKDIFYFHLGMGCQEAIWKNRIGFAVNVRAFELGLEAMFRSQDFAGSFKAQGAGVNLGIRFGW